MDHLHMIYRKVTYGYATFDINSDNTLTYKFFQHPDELLDGDPITFDTLPVRSQRLHVTLAHAWYLQHVPDRCSIP